MKTRIAHLLIPVFLSGCGSHDVVRGDGKYTGKGLTYYLPQTSLVATIPIVRIDKKAGEFAKYAEVLFLKKPKIDEDKTTFSIGEEVSIGAIGEKDSTQKFTSIYSRGFNKSALQKYTLNSEGILNAGNASIENKTVEYVVGAIEAAGKIALAGATPTSDAAATLDFSVFGKGMEELALHVFPKPESKIGDEKTKEKSQILNISIEYLLSDDPKQYLENIEGVIEEVVRAMENDVLNLENSLLRAPGEPPVDIKEAERVKKKVEKIKRSKEKVKSVIEKFGERDEIYKGNNFSELVNAVKLFNEYKRMVGDLGTTRSDVGATVAKEKAEEIYNRFFGTTTKKIWNAQFKWTPSARKKGKYKNISCPRRIFTIDSKKGIKPKDFHIKPEKSPRNFIIYKDDAVSEDKVTVVSFDIDSKVPKTAEKWESLPERKCDESRGWHFKVPAMSTVKIVSSKDGVLARKRQSIAQHGHVAFVPASGLGASVQSDIELDPITGALKTLTQGTTAFDPALVGRVADTYAARRENKKAREAEAQAVPDPLEALRREKEELELRAAIDALRAAGQ